MVEGWFQDDLSMYLLCTLFLILLHQLYLRSPAIRFQRLETPGLTHPNRKSSMHSIIKWKWYRWNWASLGGSDSKESACHARDLGSVPGLGRSPGGGHGNPLQYSRLENPHGQRSLVGYSPWGHKESDTTEWLSTQHIDETELEQAHRHKLHSPY